MNKGPTKIVQIAVAGGAEGDTLYALDADGKLHMASVQVKATDEALVTWLDQFVVNE